MLHPHPDNSHSAIVGVCLGVINILAARVDLLLHLKTPEDYGHIRISVEAYCIRLHLYRSHFRSSSSPSLRSRSPAAGSGGGGGRCGGGGGPAASSTRRSGRRGAEDPLYRPFKTEFKQDALKESTSIAKTPYSVFARGGAAGARGGGPEVAPLSAWRGQGAGADTRWAGRSPWGTAWGGWGPGPARGPAG
jgi:hypothetical protein